ncbi:uncharacterized protein LOC122299861 [Carya illinoinensis]|uniref:Embryo defective 1703 n=2 Tax=Carya illinoinensis TaxID=32201 RepID=A0A8T1RC71_CARIL|nr:uncharacterized protein LOC122299861 [Carya illinoinensis]KAG6663692.1 hypothetical protein CIPAW_02G041000 [Carya illinoinensis]
MEVRTLPNPITPLVLFGTSSFSHKFPTNTWSKRPSFRYNIPSSKFFSNPSFRIFLPSRNNRSLRIRILAHFGRPASRRNSLRKKLVENQQVLHNPSSDFQNANLSFDDNCSLSDNSNSVGAEESEFNHGGVFHRVEYGGREEIKSKRLGESVLSNKLKNWVGQYKRDIEDWGTGSGPIFTVFEDLEGNVKWVSVDDDEILRRSRVNRLELEESTEANLKILRAENLAREMESGKCVIPRNSSVAKFIVQGVESGFVKAAPGFTLRPELLPKLSRVGTTVLFGFVVLWAVKKVFSFGGKEVYSTEKGKEMTRGKIELGKKKDIIGVEIVQETSEPTTLLIEKPKLDKEKLMNSITKAKACTDTSSSRDSFGNLAANSMDLDNKVQEIRQMTGNAGEIEGPELSQSNRDGRVKQVVNKEPSSEIELVDVHSEEAASSLSNLPNGDLGQSHGIYGTIRNATLEEPKFDDAEFFSKLTSVEDTDMKTFTTPSEKVSDDKQSIMHDIQDTNSSLKLKDTRELIQSSDTPDGESFKYRSIKTKPRVILSVKEARDYLSEKLDNREPSVESQVKTVQKSADVLRIPIDEEFGSNTSQKFDANDEVAAISGQTSDYIPSTNASEVSPKESLPTSNDDYDDSESGFGVGDIQKPQTSLNHEVNGVNAETGSSAKMENWIQTNFHEVEPIVKKIGVGFKDNYLVAREKVDESLENLKISQLGLNEDDSELEWMKDDSLREIVFQVRENELAGRDPFYLMDAEDKHAFFRGLENKVEKENEKLSKLHEWLHSNIENLDYGADGISLYDPPEKIIPRWKVPVVEKNPEFLNNFLEQRKAFLSGNTSGSYPLKKDHDDSIPLSIESPTPENVVASLPTLDSHKKTHDGVSKFSKTIIEGSDGSVKAGTKSGKEYWQHTKKWSRGFLESYNAETDPEVKSIMKDMGKDLDRWITEKEIEEVADMMTNIPEKNKKFMEKKLNKLKREMELFGPQAVVSKYREYADENEEDYLWWLDLPHVLCIELYTVHNGEQRVGFYSLEMATDLELEPKPYHVIAFEDAGDCKNLCCIIQAHMDMLGNGHAFVVPQRPKDAFREAKGNGFNVTVIRKGELQLDVDQTLEEVEEQITEIGSKLYHDNITKERSVDISSLMKGVFGAAGKPTKRKNLKRMLKKPGKK